ncbi:hypothetical protein [Frondihabitans sp. PhB188]|uniref:hypothetical protein n=1 Tax=Frondihabitans sp. PhB188 TaxID=2485200 RepID=UPI0011CE87BD|nr:hypothetical protein [Frondihabitans sp. PhB188]
MTAESEVILAPRSIRVLNFCIFVFLVMICVFIAVYPPIRVVQTVIAGVAAAVALTASIRVLRSGYVLTPSTLRVRGLLVTSSIPKHEIASFPTAGVVERHDHWGGTTNVGTVMFREDRLGRQERQIALSRLRAWLATSATGEPGDPPS